MHIGNFARGLCAVAAITAFSVPASAQEVVLGAQTALPTQHTLSISFIENFVNPLNEAGEGVVQINLLGGPEVNPQDRAGQALQRGLIDILWIPGAFISGLVPQAQAMMLQNIGIEEMRSNGTFEEVFNPIFEDRLNAHFLAWSETGAGYYLYTTRAPEMVDGVVDLTGLSMRTTGAYRPIQEALNATTVAIPSGDVPTALERGIIDGFGWPTVGLASIGLETTVDYRIEPSFYNLANVVLINKDKWDGLSQEAQDLITEIALQYELTSVEAMHRENELDIEAADAAGIEAITMEGEAAERYLSIAFEAMWSEVESNIGEEETDRLRSYLYRSE